MTTYKCDKCGKIVFNDNNVDYDINEGTFPNSDLKGQTFSELRKHDGCGGSLRAIKENDKK